MKFQSTQKRKLVAAEEIIEDQPQEKTVKSNTSESNTPEQDPQSNSSSSLWSLKDNKPVQKKSSSLIGIVTSNNKKANKPLTEMSKPIDEAKEDVKVTTSGLSLLGAYSDSDNSD